VLGITHLGSGIFGLPVALILMVVVSLLTAPPPQHIQDLVESLRTPGTDDDAMSKQLTGMGEAKS
jgi:cation/acetate symporter